MPSEEPAVIGFEVRLNGRPLCTSGLGGNSGVLTVMLDWVTGRPAHQSLHVGGLESQSSEHLVWAMRKLRSRDEVAIRVVENAKPSRVRRRYRLGKKSPEQQERDWLRKTAKKHGYKLVKI